MGFGEGIRLLQELGARPDVLYWEGFPHEEGTLETLTQVQQVRTDEGPRLALWCGGLSEWGSHPTRVFD